MGVVVSVPQSRVVLGAVLRDSFIGWGGVQAWARKACTRLCVRRGAGEQVFIVLY